MQCKISISFLSICSFLILFTNPAYAQTDSAHLSVSKQAVQTLVKSAESTNSDAFIIEQNGQTVAEYYETEERLIETMSVTKLIVSIGVGKLLTEGHIDSLNQPVYTFYPEWNQGNKKKITLRHILTHTSGLQNVRMATKEIYPSPDVVKLALSAELEQEPGTQFSYNNKAVNLLAGIFEKASGKSMDQYLEQELFHPMGIKKYRWSKDDAGNPYAMSGLQLYAKDIAKFGRLVLNNGVWEGHQLVSSDYIEKMAGKNTDGEFGLLWRKLPESSTFSLTEEDLQRLKEKGVSEKYIQKLKPYLNTEIDGSNIQKVYIEIFGNPEVLQREFIDKGVKKIFSSEIGDIAGYYGDGYLGQYLIILPRTRIVIVRLIESSDDYNRQTDEFREILQLALKL